MMQSDAMCTVLAAVLVLAILSPAARELLKPPTASRPSKDCGCDAAPSMAAARKAAVTSTKKTPPATPPSPPSAMPKSNSKKSTKPEQTLSNIKKNLTHANRVGREMSTCRDDYIARTGGVRTGVLHVMLAQSEKKRRTTTPFVPWSGAPENAVPITATSETMYE